MTAIQRVLLVEDLPEVSNWLSGCLEASLAPRTVVIAATLAQAQQHIEHDRFDLALLDLGLPDGRGETLIPAFKASNAGALCIITTIFDDADHLFGALRAGADGYLLKDDADGDFILQLKGILNGRPPLSASIALRLLEQFQPAQDVEVHLTPREKEVLTLIAKGLSIKHVADHLSISAHTASGYLKIIYRKLQVNTRAEVTQHAIGMRLICPL